MSTWSAPTAGQGLGSFGRCAPQFGMKPVIAFVSSESELKAEPKEPLHHVVAQGFVGVWGFVFLVRLYPWCVFLLGTSILLVCFVCGFFLGRLSSWCDLSSWDCYLLGAFSSWDLYLLGAFCFWDLCPLGVLLSAAARPRLCPGLHSLCAERSFPRGGRRTTCGSHWWRQGCEMPGRGHSLARRGHSLAHSAPDALMAAD